MNKNSLKITRLESDNSIQCPPRPGSLEGRSAMISKNVAQNIADMLRKAALSQSELAKAIGVSQSKVSRWTSGQMPDDVDIEKITNYFGITYADLVSEPNILIDAKELDTLLKELARYRGYKIVRL